MSPRVWTSTRSVSFGPSDEEGQRRRHNVRPGGRCPSSVRLRPSQIRDAFKAAAEAEIARLAASFRLPSAQGGTYALARDGLPPTQRAHRVWR
jgi:hypothetical protein